MALSVSFRAVLVLASALAAPVAKAEVFDLKFLTNNVVPAQAGFFDVAVVSGPAKLISIHAWNSCGDCLMMFTILVDGKVVESGLMGSLMGNGLRLPNESLQQYGDASTSKFHYALPEALRFANEVKVRMRVSSFVVFPANAGARIVTAAP